MPTRYIALDLGQVCIKLSPQRTLDFFHFPSISITDGRVSGIPLDLLERIDLYERGKIPVEDFLYTLRKTLKNPIDMDDDALIHGWNLILDKEMPGIADFVREALSLGYRFAFFSDTNENHFLECLTRLSFAHLIDGRITSYEVGAKKPEPLMFQSFERTFGQPVLYFDDRPENIAVARSEHGWNAHLFTTVRRAMNDLHMYHAAESKR